VGSGLPGLLELPPHAGHVAIAARSRNPGRRSVACMMLHSDTNADALPSRIREPRAAPGGSGGRMIGRSSVRTTTMRLTALMLVTAFPPGRGGRGCRHHLPDRGRRLRSHPRRGRRGGPRHEGPRGPARAPARPRLDNGGGLRPQADNRKDAPVRGRRFRAATRQVPSRVRRSSNVGMAGASASPRLSWLPSWATAGWSRTTVQRATSWPARGQRDRRQPGVHQSPPAHQNLLRRGAAS
jgi:hypothetical protein